jgi:hypothetical protein
VIYRLIEDLREWSAADRDWRVTRRKLEERYGYEKFPGNCHMVPNHGVILLALLRGGGDFQKTLMIANTSGWDTDCNSGNVGCLMGIRGGLAGIEDGPDWRGPVADRLYLPTADGGRCITDAVQETCRIVNLGRALAGEGPIAPKGGARFHFSLPGSVQGWRAERSPEVDGVCAVEYAGGRLAIRFRQLAAGRAARAATDTFITPEALRMPGYALIASPTIYAGQTLRARLEAGAENSRDVTVRPYLSVYDTADALNRLPGPSVTLEPGRAADLVWTVPDTEGFPIAQVGLEILSERRADGAVLLDSLTWDGCPDVTFRRTAGGTLWKRAWVDGADHFEAWPSDDVMRVTQDRGTGLVIQGTREWKDYRVSARVTPHLARSCGLAARVQGMGRYYALVLCHTGEARLVKQMNHCEQLTAFLNFRFERERPYTLALEVDGGAVRAYIDGELLIEDHDPLEPLMEGAVGLVVEEGRMTVEWVKVEPLG